MKRFPKALAGLLSLLFFAGCTKQSHIPQVPATFKQLVFQLSAILGDEREDSISSNKYRIFESYGEWITYCAQNETIKDSPWEVFEYSEDGSYAVKSTSKAINEYSTIFDESCIIVVQFYHTSSYKFKVDKIEKIDGDIVVTIIHPSSHNLDIMPWSIAIELPAGYATSDSEVQILKPNK